MKTTAINNNRTVYFGPFGVGGGQTWKPFDSTVEQMESLISTNPSLLAIVHEKSSRSDKDPSQCLSTLRSSRPTLIPLRARIPAETCLDIDTLGDTESRGSVRAELANSEARMTWTAKRPHYVDHAVGTLRHHVTDTNGAITLSQDDIIPGVTTGQQCKHQCPSACYDARNKAGSLQKGASPTSKQRSHYMQIGFLLRHLQGSVQHQSHPTHARHDPKDSHHENEDSEKLDNNAGNAVAYMPTVSRLNIVPPSPAQLQAKRLVS